MDPLSFRWLTFQTRYRSEMDFSWDAMGDADRKVKQLRRHMAEWAPGPGDAPHDLGDAAKGFDARVRAAFADDLDLPAALVVVNELDHSADVPDDDKYALLASWDHVLGLDLEREARSTWEPTAEMLTVMTRRDEARAAKDYAASDALRDELRAMGVEVKDTPDGTRVRPRDG